MPWWPSLATFDLQVTPMLSSKFGVNWPLNSGEEAKNRFSRWQPWQPSWISDLSNLATFDLQFTQMLPTRYRQLDQECRSSRLLKQLLTPHDGRQMTDID